MKMNKKIVSLSLIALLALTTLIFVTVFNQADRDITTTNRKQAPKEDSSQNEESLVFSESGTYGEKDHTEVIEGDVIVESPDVTLQNMKINGNLILEQSIGEGEVYLDKIEVAGTTFIYGGGENSVYVNDSSFFKVIVNKELGNVRVVISGYSTIEQTIMQSGGTLEGIDVSTEAIGDVIISIDPKSKEKVVYLSGSFSSVSVEVPNITVHLVSGSIGKMLVDEKLHNVTLNFAENTNIDYLESHSTVHILGKGKINNAVVNDDQSTFETRPENLSGSNTSTRTENNETASNHQGDRSNEIKTEKQNNSALVNRSNNKQSSKKNERESDSTEKTLPFIKKINPVSNMTTDYGTDENDVLAKLLKTTTITDSNGKDHRVALNWRLDDYDPNKPGKYTAIGTFKLPNGIAQAEPPIDLKVTTDVTVNKPSIMSIEAVDHLVVKYGTIESAIIDQLPATITILDRSNTTHLVNLKWTIKDYDSSKPGDYVATGTFALPSGVIQSTPPKKLQATAKITVKNPVIVSIASVSGIEVDFATSLLNAIEKLPKSTTIRASDGFTYYVPLHWTIPDYEGEKVGAYTAIGTFQLPDGIDQSEDPLDLSVGATVFVKADLTRYIQLLQAVKKDDYTADSWQSYEAIVNSHVVTERSDQADVNLAVNAIEQAQKDLVFAGREALDKKLAEIALLNELDYTEESWSILEAALRLPENSNDDVVNKTSKITDAINGLVKKVPSKFIFEHSPLTNVIAGKKYPFALTVKPDEEKHLGYENVRFEVSIEHPEHSELQLLMNDADGNEIDIAKRGYFGPSKIDKSFHETTNFNIHFNRIGSYTLHFKLIDEDHNDIITDKQVSFSVQSALYDVPKASVNTDSSEIIVDFGAPLQELTDEVTGFTLTVDDEPIDIVSAKQDPNHLANIRIIPEESIATGIVKLSYNGNELEAIDGGIVSTFDNVIIETAWQKVKQMKEHDKTIAEIVDSLKAEKFKMYIIYNALVAHQFNEPDVNDYLQNEVNEAIRSYTNEQYSMSDIINKLNDLGFMLDMIAQGLLENNFAAEDIVSEFNTLSIPAEPVGVALLLAGFSNADIISLLSETYDVTLDTIVTILMPSLPGSEDKEDLVETLLELLVEVDVTDEADWAKALQSIHVDESKAIIGVWDFLKNEPQKRKNIGIKLEEGGYDFYNTFNILYNKYGKAAVTTAWADYFQAEDGSEVTMEVMIQNLLTNTKLTKESIDDITQMFFPTIWSSPYELVPALRQGGYDAVDIAHRIRDFWAGQHNQNSHRINMLKTYANFSPFEIAHAMHTVYGYNARQIYTDVPDIGQIPEKIALLQDLGFSVNDIVNAINLNDDSFVINHLLNAGYTAEQALKAMEHYNNRKYNTNEIINIFSWKISLYELVSILQKHLKVDAYTAGSSLLLSGNGFKYRDVATVLIELYGINGEEFIEIRNSNYRPKKPSGATLITNVNSGENCLICILKDEFNMDASEMLVAMKGLARTNDYLENIVAYVFERYDISDHEQKIQMLSESGYTFTEIAQIMKHILSYQEGDLIVLLKDAGYSAESIAKFMFEYFYLKNALSDITVTKKLWEAGFGTCENLNPIVSSLKIVYNSSDERLLYVLNNSDIDCSETDFIKAISEIGDSEDMPLLAIEMLKAKVPPPVPTSQAIQMLREVFGITNYMEIATLLRDAKYVPYDKGKYYTEEALTILRNTLELTPEQAKNVLMNVFAISDINEVTKTMLASGYSITEVVSLLDTTDPVILKEHLQKMNVRPIDTLIFLFQPGSHFDDPLALSSYYKALGLSATEATNIMKGFGFTPVKMAAILLANGYDLKEVQANVRNNIPGSSEAKQNGLIQVLTELMECTSSDISGLPFCEERENLFTFDDFIQGLVHAYGFDSLSCEANMGLCSYIFNDLQQAGYSPAFIGELLYTKYHLSLRQLGYLLANDDYGGLSITEIKDLLYQKQPYNLNINQLAESFLETYKYTSSDVYELLYSITNSQEQSFRAMFHGGFDAYRVGSAMSDLEGASRFKVRHNLQVIGFSYNEAVEVAMKIYPPDENLIKMEGGRPLLRDLFAMVAF